MNKEKISFEEFVDVSSKLEIKSGQVIFAGQVPKSKLTKLIVDFDEDQPRTVLTNLNMNPDKFIGNRYLFVTNLIPLTLKGIESQAMILVGTSILGAEELNNFSNGSKIL